MTIKELSQLESINLERYIAGIEDSLTRLIFTYRFSMGLSWTQVANSVGGNNTPEGVRKRVYRYLGDKND